MIRRDKENRNLRLLRRERLNERLDKMHKGCGMPHNTTAEDMEKITRLTRQKECSEQKHTVRMMLIVMGVCIIIASVLVSYLPANSKYSWELSTYHTSAWASDCSCCQSHYSIYGNSRPACYVQPLSVRHA